MFLSVLFLARRLISSNELMKGKEQAEKIGKNAAEKLYKYLKPQKPVGPHLADQLIPYIGLAKGHSVIEVSEITKHTLTNIWVAEQLLNIHYYVKGDEGEPGTISVSGIGYKA